MLGATSLVCEIILFYPETRLVANLMSQRNITSDAAGNHAGTSFVIFYYA